MYKLRKNREVCYVIHCITKSSYIPHVSDNFCFFFFFRIVLLFMTRLELRLAVKLWLDKAGSCMCGFDEDTAAALDVAFIYSLVSKHFG